MAPPPGAPLHRSPEDVRRLRLSSALWLQRAAAHLRRPDVRTDPAPVQHRHAAGQQDLPEPTQHGHEVHLLRRQVGRQAKPLFQSNIFSSFKQTPFGGDASCFL